MTIGTVGIRGAVAVEGGALSLRGSAGYQRTGGDRTPVAQLALAGTTSFAAIRAVPLDRDAFAGEAGIDVRVTKTVTFGASYTGVIGENVSDNGVKGTLTIGF